MAAPQVPNPAIASYNASLAKNKKAGALSQDKYSKYKTCSDCPAGPAGTYGSLPGPPCAVDSLSTLRC